MKLVFERSRSGRGTAYLPALDVPEVLPDSPERGKPLRLPELPEIEVDRHYTELAREAYGVNDGFYPLGSCTMNLLRDSRIFIRSSRGRQCRAVLS